MILIIDISQKEATVALKNNENVTKETWEGGRELSSTIFDKIDRLFEQSVNISEVKAIIVNAGPGSYTGLRIGISIANALAYSLNIPIVGVENSSNFENLVEEGLRKLKGKAGFTGSIIPFYGSEPNITQPKNK